MRRIFNIFTIAALVWMVEICSSAIAADNTTTGSGVVSGTVTYLQRIALTPDATVSVQLRDISRMDAPAPLIGETRIQSPGQVPVPFEISYDPAVIDPRFSYSVSARMLRGDKLLFISDTVHPVITRGHPDTMEIIVRPVR